MLNLQPFTPDTCKTLIKKRKGESKFGEDIQFISDFTNIYESIKNLDVDYVIFGIAEDIGVYANNGKAGTKHAWEALLKVLLNTQSNEHTQPNRVLILGHLEYDGLFETLNTFKKRTKKRINKARKLVETIDADVTHLVYSIIKAGKIPIIIGGGHNNSYGNIKGTSLALNSQINVINFDAHTDFRPEEGRHSGNGFSYAFAEGFLANYFMFGIHENYTSSQLFKTLKKLRHMEYITYDSLIRKEISFKMAINKGFKHIMDTKFGIEIDCDAIENISSSAQTPSGFNVKETRRFVTEFAKKEGATYLHICEAIPSESSETNVGKLITYLITDFMKAHGSST